MHESIGLQMWIAPQARHEIRHVISAKQRMAFSVQYLIISIFGVEHVNNEFIKMFATRLIASIYMYV